MKRLMPIREKLANEAEQSADSYTDNMDRKRAHMNSGQVMIRQSEKSHGVAQYYAKCNPEQLDWAYLSLMLPNEWVTIDIYNL